MKILWFKAELSCLCNTVEISMIFRSGMHDYQRINLGFWYPNYNQNLLL